MQDYGIQSVSTRIEQEVNMKLDAAGILREALKLPPEARAAVAGSLLDSLEETVDEDVEAAWQAEILVRLQEIDKGAVKLVPWAEARRHIAGR
jgi:putative addiction module component (TIGR02574 family)